jgi:DNA-binding MarR family transcriptional regulator
MATPPSDPEVAATHTSAPSDADPAGLRIWLRLLACHNQIEQELRSKLRREFDTTMPRFDMMAQLDRYPQGLRMQDLSRLLMVTGGNITGLTDRMVNEGLLERHEDPSDRRAYIVRLTDKGHHQFAAMAEQHAKWVDALFDGLDKTTLTALSDQLDRLKRHLK